MLVSVHYINLTFLGYTTFLKISCSCTTIPLCTEKICHRNWGYFSLNSVGGLCRTRNVSWCILWLTRKLL